MTAVVMRGDAANLQLPDECVDLIVTSPPYFGLRSYTDGGEHYTEQIGAEATPAEYLDALIACTAEWIRVLKPSGSIFVNLGDKYSSGSSGQSRMAALGAQYRGGGHTQERAKVRTDRVEGMPPKSLLGLPWRYAIRCMDELGLVLRSEIVWAKPNGLPESVTDRVRRSHEQVFHLTKAPRYFSSVDHIREEHKAGQSPAALSFARTGRGTSPGQTVAPHRVGRADQGLNPMGKLPGSVWSIATAPLKVPADLEVEHFAAYPPELVRRIVLGWSPREVCTVCGEGRRPVASSVGLDMTRPQARRAHALAEAGGLHEGHLRALLSVGVSDTGRGAATQTGTGKNTPEVYALAAEAQAVLGGYAREYLLRRPTGFTDACACPDTSAATTPGVVLDPFGGTGTTALVASVHGRVGLSNDLSADYCRIARWRTNDPKQRAKAAGRSETAQPRRCAGPEQMLIEAVAPQ